MNKNYLALWGLLAVAFILFFGISMCSDPHIGSWHIKSSGMAQALLADTLPHDTIAAPPDDFEEPQVEEPVDTTPRTILFIGDSMVECLGPRLGAYCKAYGHKLYNVIWYSSTTELYGTSHLISDYIATLHPDYIIISLGGNELFVSDIIEKRDKYVKSILADVADIPYLWIGPPNWKADTGINRLIEQNVKKGSYFKSDGMQFQRKKDGAHPTAESSVEWMDSIARWIPLHCRYKLPLAQPQESTARPVRQFVHQPGELKHRPKP